jgi:hypothetical protein
VRSRGTEQQNNYLKEEGRTIEQLVHPSMPASRSIGFGIASTKLHLKDLLFPHDNELKVDLNTVVQSTIATLNDDADAYDDNLSEALQLAERIGFKVDPGTIPAKMHTPRRPLQGPLVAGSNVAMGINCDMANVFDVAGAARLAEALSSELDVRVAPASVAEPRNKAG